MVSRSEALVVWGRVARRRVVVVMPGEGSFIVVLASVGFILVVEVEVLT